MKTPCFFISQPLSHLLSPLPSQGTTAVHISRQIVAAHEHEMLYWVSPKFETRVTCGTCDTCLPTKHVSFIALDLLSVESLDQLRLCTFES